MLAFRVFQRTFMHATLLTSSFLSPHVIKLFTIPCHRSLKPLKINNALLLSIIHFYSYRPLHHIEVITYVFAFIKCSSLLKMNQLMEKLMHDGLVLVVLFYSFIDYQSASLLIEREKCYHLNDNRRSLRANASSQGFYLFQAKVAFLRYYQAQGFHRLQLNFGFKENSDRIAPLHFTLTYFLLKSSQKSLILCFPIL